MINYQTYQYSDTYIPLPEHAIFLKLTSLDRTVNAYLIVATARKGFVQESKNMSEKHQRLAKWIDRWTVIHRDLSVLDTTCTYRAISYLSDFQLLA